MTVADNLTFGGVGIDREFPQPYVAVDRSDPDIAYVAWSSDRLTGDGDRDIFLARCNFTGTMGSCEAPVRINKNTIGDGTDQYFPMLCVDPNNRILLSWDDQRAGGNSTAIYHTEVTANGGGLSVGPNFLTSEVNFTPMNFGGTPDYVDYNENNDACDGQHLYVAWTSHVSPPGILPASNDVDIFFAVANNLQDVRVNGPLDFGTVCIGDSQTLPLEIFNVGDATLTVNNVSRVAGSTDITVDPDPTVPLTISPDAHVDFSILCTATMTPGPYVATIRVESDDPDQPQIDLQATCNIGEPLAETTGELNFGDTCIGDSNTDTVKVCNTGVCDLTVTNVALVAGMGGNCDDLSIVNPPTTPFIISKDFCFDFEVKYEPNDSTPPADCSLVVSTNATTPTTFPITANVPAPDINISMANAGFFGDVCSVDLKDLNLQIINQGACDLTITAINVTDVVGTNNFTIPFNLQFPLVLSPNATVDVPIRFDPNPAEACDDTNPRSADITIVSDDPDEPNIVQNVRGIVPCPNATPKGQLNFGQLCIGESKNDTIEVCNTGKCNLTVTSVALVPGMSMGTDGCDDLTIVNPPALPLTISKDFCFNFKVEFTPDDLIPPDCSLVITTDDPDTPTITFPITASVGEPNIVLDPPNLDGIYAFPATVAEPGGLGCFSDKMLVIRNNGTCPLVISGIGASATPPFSVIAPTIFPITLPVGEETLKVTVRFDPTGGGGDPFFANQNTGTLTVMSNDPDGGGSATGGLCGEFVEHSGVRELVVNGFDVPITGLDSLTLTSKGINTPSPINIKLTNSSPMTDMVCNKSFQYHLNREDLPTTQTTGSNPRSSYTAKAKEGNKQASKSFSLGQCEFKEFILKLK